MPETPVPTTAEAAPDGARPRAMTPASASRVGLWCLMNPQAFGLLAGDPMYGGIRVIADAAAVPGCVTAENARGQRFPVWIDAIDRAAAPGTPPLWHKAWSPPYAEVHHWLAGPEWRAVLVADDAWSAELRRAFGERARDRRYDADDSSHPPACRRARAHLAVAREIAEACCPISKPARRLPVRPGAETEEARMVAEILAVLAGQPAPGASSDDPRVEAEVHSDDRTFEVPFDATPFFARASDEDIVALARCGWGGDYPADAVAEYCEGLYGDEDIAGLMHYCRRRRNMGFECRVDRTSAIAWLRLHRPHLIPEIEAGP